VTALLTLQVALSQGQSRRLIHSDTNKQAIAMLLPVPLPLAAGHAHGKGAWREQRRARRINGGDGRQQGRLWSMVHHIG